MTNRLSDTLSVGLTPTDAATRLGVSERTIWRHIKAGKLKTEHTADGVRVLLTDSLSDNHVSVSDTTTDNVSDRADGSPAPELMKALEMVSSLTQRNEQLAGQVGFLQARVQDQERQIALLQAPKDEPQDDAPPARRSWWQRLRGK